ncbi:phage holin [Bacillus sp. FJAT-27251]|uniref:phage holin n=1 Tax=Bacillus sp. FJAT-27251 TaxID=1684142 RepID=UPI0006A7D270|nr:phage holin [Bacillus sp. FJAT-27251]
MINWRVRFKNKSWVLAALSQVMLVTQVIFQALNLLGLTEFQLTQQLQGEILALTNGAFIIMSMLGLIQDPTTRGIKDSVRASKYRKPN